MSPQLVTGMLSPGRVNYMATGSVFVPSANDATKATGIYNADGSMANHAEMGSEPIPSRLSALEYASETDGKLLGQHAAELASMGIDIFMLERKAVGQKRLCVILSVAVILQAVALVVHQSANHPKTSPRNHGQEQTAQPQAQGEPRPTTTTQREELSDSPALTAGASSLPQNPQARIPSDESLQEQTAVSLDQKFPRQSAADLQPTEHSKSESGHAESSETKASDPTPISKNKGGRE